MIICHYGKHLKVINTGEEGGEKDIDSTWENNVSIIVFILISNIARVFRIKKKVYFIFIYIYILFNYIF